MQQRPIPPAALEDPEAVEMLRVWIANRGLHSSIKVGMYKETTRIPEERAWGRILADVARHIASALSDGYGSERDISLAAIAAAFNSQLDNPQTDVRGGFHKTN